MKNTTNTPPTHKKPDFDLNREENDLKIIQQIIDSLIENSDDEDSYVIKDEVYSSINNFIACTCLSNLPEKIDQIRAALYILVNKIKSDFITRTTLLAQQENEFFKFTITIITSKNKNSESKTSDKFLEAIYWSKRNASVENGIVKNYYYTRIPLPNDKNEELKITYNRKSFSSKGASKWQIDECCECEKKLAVIRNVLKRLSDIKRSLLWCSIFTDNLVKILQSETDENQKLLSANIQSEKTDEEKIELQHKQAKKDFYSIKNFNDLFAYQKKYGNNETDNTEQNSENELE